MSILNNLLDMCIKFLWFVLKWGAIILAPIALIFCFYMVYWFCKGKRFKKRTVKLPKPKYTKKGVLHSLKMLFLDFPRRFALDLYERDPDAFNMYGLHFFCGEQGSGKSIAVVHFLKQLHERYPACSIRSNISLDFQDAQIDSPESLLDESGTTGQANFIDEIQNWFNSLESKDMPPAVAGELCQQRKQAKILLGTSQVFNRMAKQLREQCTLLYEPFTLFGCLTIVRVYKPKITEEGSVDKKILRRIYFFVHDDELRNSYDTYEKIKRITMKGYKPRSEQLGSSQFVLDFNNQERKRGNRTTVRLPVLS